MILDLDAYIHVSTMHIYLIFDPDACVYDAISLILDPDVYRYDAYAYDAYICDP